MRPFSTPTFFYFHRCCFSRLEYACIKKEIQPIRFVRERVRLVGSLLLLLLAATLVYWDVGLRLSSDWMTDDNYSHGFLIVPIAAYFAWERRRKLAEAIQSPSNLGLIIVFGSMLLLIVGTVGSEFFLTRISILGTLAGSILFLFGWSFLRVLLFPLAFLTLMIPIPRILFDRIVFPLQLLASQLAENTLSIAGIPVLREGNLIVLANATLEVAEACSGIRSLVSLLTLAIVYGYLADPRPVVRIVLAVATVPVAIVANGLRVAGTGFAAHYYGAAAADAFFDAFSGWILFSIAFGGLFCIYRFIVLTLPIDDRFSSGEPPVATALPVIHEDIKVKRIIIITTVLFAALLCIATSTVTEAVALRTPLNRLSMQLGKWKGQPAPAFDERIVAKLGADEYLTRFFIDPAHVYVHLYVGYHKSQRQGNSIHSPQNCLPGAGWQPIKGNYLSISLASGNTIQVNRFVIQKGLEKQLVLYWYQSHGRVVASEYLAKAYLVWDAVRTNRSDGALVRVITPIADSEVKSEQEAVGFIRELFPILERHLSI